VVSEQDPLSVVSQTESGFVTYDISRTYQKRSVESGVGTSVAPLRNLR